MIMRKAEPALLALALLFAIVFAGYAARQLPQQAASSSDTIHVVTVKNVFADSEFKAVWVPYMSLDMSHEQAQHFGAFKQKFDRIVAQVQASGANTMIVHVRPFGDAMYRSAYFPWSHLLTGTQGQDPGYDPLAYMVEAAHAAGLKLHAWINPLRIRSTQTPAQLAANNVRTVWQSDGDSTNDDWTVECSSGIYLNPGYESVRTYIIDSVRELIEHYAVDGVHMDDYFYPTQEESFDTTAYANYCAGVSSDKEPLSLEAWRTENITALVKGLYDAVKAYDANLQFGISPQGNRNNCAKACADVAKWGGETGYVDYLCPQLYYPFQSPSQPFAQVAQEWRDMVTAPSVKLYGGLALYKAGDGEVDSGSWTSGDVLQRQIETLEQAGFGGFALYSDAYLTGDQTKTEMANVRACLGVVDSAAQNGASESAAENAESVIRSE